MKGVLIKGIYWLGFASILIEYFVKILMVAIFDRDSLYDKLQDWFFDYGSYGVYEALERGYFQPVKKVAIKYGMRMDHLINTASDLFIG